MLTKSVNSSAMITAIFYSASSAYIIVKDLPIDFIAEIEQFSSHKQLYLSAFTGCFTR
jgi:hypothetical protein